MKRCEVAVSVVAALAFVSVAAASATMTGKYATTITKPAAVKGPGHWTQEERLRDDLAHWTADRLARVG
jgi:hypothetical protein